MVTMSCLAWLSSQTWTRFSRASVVSGRSSRNAKGMMIGQKAMTTKTKTAMTWVVVEYFPATRWCRAVS